MIHNFALLKITGQQNKLHVPSTMINGNNYEIKRIITWLCGKGKQQQWTKTCRCRNHEGRRSVSRDGFEVTVASDDVIL